MVAFPLRTRKHGAAAGAMLARTMTPDERPAPRAAAIVDDGSGRADALLAAIVAAQRQRGRHLCGLTMSYVGGDVNGCAREMLLVDLQTAREYLVSQPLGSGSRGCRADPQGFARASEVLRLAADAAPDLVISNRFGGLEAAGGGFCAELLELMVRDIPLLTVVSERHVEAWQRFSGDAPLLPADAAAVDAWLSASLAPAAAPAA